MWFGKIEIEDRTDDHKKRLGKLNSRFNRWQDKQINLLTFAINLFVSLSVAAIGFLFTNSEDKLFDKIICESYSLGRTVSVFFLFSLFAGIMALVFRLNDFRATTNIIKWRKIKYKIEEGLKYEARKEINIKLANSKIECLKSCYEILGILTWFMFYMQIILFLSASAVLICNI